MSDIRRRSMAADAEITPVDGIRETVVTDMSSYNSGLVWRGKIDGQPNPDPSSSTPGQRYRTGRKPVDLNVYATKKTIAKGMMDVALLTSNASQLRFVLESGEYGQKGTNYYISILLISLSIVFQVLIGIMLIFIGRHNVHEEAQARKADKLNNLVVLGVFLITTINVFISSFAVGPLDPVFIRNMLDEKNSETL